MTSGTGKIVILGHFIHFAQGRLKIIIAEFRESIVELFKRNLRIIQHLLFYFFEQVV